MLRSIKEINGYKISATDGNIGKVHDFFFDDEIWAIRYFVVDLGTWIPGRKVLLIPSVFGEAEWKTLTIPVRLTKDQIRQSPDMRTDIPVSRQEEIKLHEHYTWVPYWAAPPPGVAPPVELLQDEKDAEKELQHADPHLRSVREVTGYHIQASDGEIGHVEEFIVDDTDWFIRYMVIDTRNWLPGRKVLVSPGWIDQISWRESKVFVDLPKEMIKKSPEYDPSAPINREYEERLYDFYGRPKYWK